VGDEKKENTKDKDGPRRREGGKGKGGMGVVDSYNSCRTTGMIEC